MTGLNKVVVTIATVLIMALPAGLAHGQDYEQLAPAKRRQLFLRGAKIWPVACGSCHLARPGSEFSPEQWIQIMQHMRVRALLPADDIEAVKVYLQSAHEPH